MDKQMIKELKDALVHVPSANPIFLMMLDVIDQFEKEVARLEAENAKYKDAYILQEIRAGNFTTVPDAEAQKIFKETLEGK